MQPDEAETGGPSTNDTEHIVYVECDGCNEEELPYDTSRGSQHTRGFQCRNCGRMY